VINSGGVKISAEEVERKLRPFIREILHHKYSEETLGQQVTLVLESNEFDKAEKQHCQKYSQTA